MRLRFLLMMILLLVVGGGFAYFATIDVPVRQSEITLTIPNDRFFDNP